MIALIMAGGSGKRFWPLSRKSNPKQFVSIEDNNSMLYNTYKRLINTKMFSNKSIYVVTAQSQASLVKKHLPMLDEKNIICEPEARNTAAAIGLSVSYFLHLGISLDTKMIVLPADHVIKGKQKFIDAIKNAACVADENYLCTFGIQPTYPATAYGYIQATKSINDFVLKVDKFKEKPDEETAKSFLQTKSFYWNSGIFLWNLSTIYNAFEQYFNQAFTILKKITKNLNDKKDISKLYSKIEKKPIDIGIMEKANKRAVVPVDYYWNDVGSFKAFYEISPKDENLNSSENALFAINSQKNFVKSKKNVALIGVNNLVVIETDDAILVVDKDKTEDIKKMYELLEKKQPNIT